jgi:hypothetical protein
VNAAPRVVLGMTLHNNARHLPEAASSILSQTYSDFVLVMLDDASIDATETVARELAGTDPRVHYIRRSERLGMVPTWREVFERATTLCPSAEYFAWLSDHDVWAPSWLATLVSKLDVHQKTVLMYPSVSRIDDAGAVVDKAPRSFDTAGQNKLSERWERFCWEGFGSGDMVYGLVRVAALRRAGVFRDVLNPDRLLIAELLLQGQIRQVPKPLWFRRQAAEASIARQRATLFAGPPPPGFWMPPAVQHVRVLEREYAKATPDGIRVSVDMRALYLVSSAWRSFRKTETSKSLGRGVDNAHFVKKVIKKTVRSTVYYTLITIHAVAHRLRRTGRRIIYHVAVLSHRLGIRTPRNQSRMP